MVKSVAFQSVRHHWNRSDETLAESLEQAFDKKDGKSTTVLRSLQLFALKAISVFRRTITRNKESNLEFGEKERVQETDQQTSKPQR